MRMKMYRLIFNGFYSNKSHSDRRLRLWVYKCVYACMRKASQQAKCICRWNDYINDTKLERMPMQRRKHTSNNIMLWYYELECNRTIEQWMNCNRIIARQWFVGGHCKREAEQYTNFLPRGFFFITHIALLLRFRQKADQRKCRLLATQTRVVCLVCLKCVCTNLVFRYSKNSNHMLHSIIFPFLSLFEERQMNEWMKNSSKNLLGSSQHP